MAMKTAYVVQPFEIHRKRLRPARPEPSQAVAGSFLDVSQRYYASTPYKKLDASTQSWQRRALAEIALSDKGTAPRALLQPKHVRRPRDEKAATPAAATTMLKALRALF